MSFYTRINMPTLHPTNRHSAKAPSVSVVTGSSGGSKGQSSSSESARSTTTPGWRHWRREMVVGKTWVRAHACVCMTRDEIYVHYILGPHLFRKQNKEKYIWEAWYMLTYIVDVRNVVFVNSHCLLNAKEFEICIITLLCQDILNVSLWMICAFSLPQPASWILQFSSPWSGTSCRSPRPPYNHSSSSWSISLHTENKLFLALDLVILSYLSVVFIWEKPSKQNLLLSCQSSTHLIGWWFRHCMKQIVWPGPWREA